MLSKKRAWPICIHRSGSPSLTTVYYYRPIMSRSLPSFVIRSRRFRFLDRPKRLIASDSAFAAGIFIRLKSIINRSACLLAFILSILPQEKEEIHPPPVDWQIPVENSTFSVFSLLTPPHLASIMVYNDNHKGYHEVIQYKQ